MPRCQNEKCGAALIYEPEFLDTPAKWRCMGRFSACLGSVCHFSDNFRKRFHLRNSFHPKPLKIPIENSPAASWTRPVGLAARGKRVHESDFNSTYIGTTV